MSSPFRSLSNVPLRNQPTRRQSRDEMAAALAVETCERYKALRREALAAEQACDVSKPWSPEAAECIETLEALVKGQHRWMVVPILIEHFPELVRPATEMEQAAADAVIAEKGLPT